LTTADKKIILKFINGEKGYNTKLKALYETIKKENVEDPYIRYLQEYFGNKKPEDSQFLKYKRIILNG
jgi:hypothetical protein